MASTLFFQTNQLICRLTLPYHPLCVSWNHSHKRWEFSIKNRFKLLPHLFATTFLSWTILLPGILSILISFFCHSDLYSVEEIAIEVLIGIFIPLAVVVDTILLVFGREVVAISTWAITTSNKLKFQDPFNDDIGFFKSFWDEQQKISWGQNVDWLAILASNVLMSGTFLSIFIPVALTFQNLDQVYILLKGISSNILINSPNLANFNFVKVFRYLIMLYIYNSIASVLTHFTIILLSVIQIGLKIVHYLNQMEVNILQVKLYRQLQVCVHLILTLDKVINGTFLCFAFVLLLICINLSILGSKLLSADIYTLVIFIMILIFVFVMLVLHVNSLIFEGTSETLKKWRGEVHLAVRVKYMKRLTMSLKPLAFPAGNIGIIDREIKVNYLYSLMIYAVNTLIACKDLV